VASGQKDIVAINIENGKEVWRHTLDNVIRAAPIIQHDKLFVSTIDNKLYFLDLADGNTLWIHEGASENIGVFGAASIAADGNMIIVPHSSGQLHALNIYNGEEIWSVNLSYQKSNITGFAISDIDVTPVIRDNKIYISNNIGSLFAINLENGAPLWKREVRGIKSIWVAGEYLYVINEHKQIIAINRENGYIKWIEKIMPEDAKAKSGDKTKFVGPLMAQDQLIAAGNNGKLYFISPLDGKNIKTINIPSNISLMPVIADGNIYILDNSGYLSIL
jgi:outer membrane protein assembly factor BamB